jgi:hypothetical protein
MINLKASSICCFVVLFFVEVEEGYFAPNSVGHMAPFQLIWWEKNTHA